MPLRLKRESFNTGIYARLRFDMAKALVKDLRVDKWKGLPSDPGVYWWYFPKQDAKRLLKSLLSKSQIQALNLRPSKDGKVCLYCGMAGSLRVRGRWHAAQKLTRSALKSRFLSTLRFTLLALTKMDYYKAEQRINRLIDGVTLEWISAKSRKDAQHQEAREFKSKFHYPLNIRSNSCAELADCVGKLQGIRRGIESGIFKRQVERQEF